MENLELKNTITKIKNKTHKNKNHLNGWANRRMEVTEKNSMKLKIDQEKLSKLKETEKKIGGKNEQSLKDP